MLKKTGHIIFIGLVLTLAAGCHKGIFVEVQKDYSPWEGHRGFVVFEKGDETDLNGEELIGKIEIKRGLTAGCALESVVAFAKTKAMNMGANALKIYDHRPPDIWVDPCYKIKAKAYRLKDVSQYEKEIIWHKKRKLEIRDFKGSVSERPFVAATSRGFRMRTNQLPVEKFATCVIETTFSCHDSYFKINADSVEILAHEQLHFNISELHARKFVKRITEEVRDINDLEVNAQRIMNEVYSDLQLMQDKYDSEVYTDRNKQSIWNKKIKDALEEWKPYEQKQVKIKIKA